MKNQQSVLFVCMGNICRSPTAEGVFRSIINAENLSNVITTDSAGTHAYHIGNSPDSRAQTTAKQHGIDLSDLTARQVKTEDFLEFDYIIGMDIANINNLQSMQSTIEETPSSQSKASLHLFMEFAPSWKNDEVPDPYYGDGNGFDEVYKMTVDASRGLLKRILSDIQR